jgi:hypothetical protein
VFGKLLFSLLCLDSLIRGKDPAEIGMEEPGDDVERA